MKQIEHVTLIGMGALGIMYGELVAEALGPGAVQFVGDEARCRRFARDGVYCNGKRCAFEMVAPEEAETPDLLIFATKAGGLASAIESARRFAGSETVVISLLNGITSEEEIEAGLGKGIVIHAVAQGMDATKTGNRLAFAHPGTLCVGFPKGEEDKKGEAYERLCAFLERVRVPFVKDPDILHRLWAKWMLNVGVNQACLVEQGGYGVVQKPGRARTRMQAAMREAMQVAQASGVNVTEEDFEFYVRLIDSLDPQGMPSMRQDGVAKRPSEVELFAGTAIRKGRELGVPVPENDSLYREIKALEATYGAKALA